MANSSESVLIFDDYSVSDMVFKRNYKYDLDVNSDIELEFNISGDAKISDDKNNAALTLTIKIFEDDFKSNSTPFYLETTIVGHFTCEGDVDIEGFQLNGMAILLPYIRSIITSFTSQSGISPIILPPINVYKVFGK